MDAEVQQEHYHRGIMVALVILLLACSARPACANPIAVTEFYVWPASWPLLLFIIPLEALFALRLLDRSFWRSMKVVGVANIASTAVGVPLAWGFAALMGFLGSGPEQSSRYSSSQGFSVSKAFVDGGSNFWISFLLFFAGNYLISVWLESRIAGRLLAGAERAHVGHWAQVANAASYLFVLALMAWRVAADRGGYVALRFL